MLLVRKLAAKEKDQVRDHQITINGHLEVLVVESKFLTKQCKVSFWHRIHFYATPPNLWALLFIVRGSKTPFNSDDQNRLMTIALVSTLGILGALAYNEMRYKEITWKEFCNGFLGKGIVS